MEVPYGESGYLPQGAPTTTWASRRIKAAMQNVRMAELAKRSLVSRLVAENANALPKSADAIFDWSHATTISISLVLPPLGAEDLPVLTRLSQSQNELYKNLASNALSKIGK